MGRPKGSKSVTIKEIEFKIINSRHNFKLLSNILRKNNRLYVKIQCLDCNLIWDMRLDSLFSDRGCRSKKCKYHIRRRSNEYIDNYLISNNIPLKRLGDFVNMHSNIYFLCLNGECNYKWKPKPHHIINNKQGCPKCSIRKRRLSNEEIDRRLKGRCIKILEDYSKKEDLSQKTKFVCLAEGCNYIWETMLHKVISGEITGCPECGGTKLSNNEKFDKKTKNHSFIRIGNYVGSRTHLKVKCKKCGNVWEATPGNLLYGYGCALCKNKNEKLIYNLLVENGIDFEYQKNIKNISPSKNKKYKVDFYINNINIIIEYNGAQHYRPVKFGGISLEEANINFKKQRKRDRFIKNFCKENNITLIEIDGRYLNILNLQKYVMKILITFITDKRIK